MNATSILDFENRTNAFFVFIAVVVISSASRLIYIFLTTKTSAKIGSYLSKLVYSKLLNKPYLEHVSRDSSYVIQMVTSNIGRTVGIISSCSLIVSSILVSLAILYTLLITEPQITFITLVLLVTTYFLIYLTSKGGLYMNGNIVKINEEKIIKLVKESLDSIREIIISNMFKKYISEYVPLDKDLRKYQAKASFIAQYPRYIIECLMIGTITTIAFVLGKNSGNILPQLAVFSLGFLRILPAIQQIYSNIANIKTYSPALDAINSCLNETSLFSEIKSSKTLHKLEDYEVNKENFGFPSMPIITLSNVSFKYPLSSEITLKDVDLEIKKGFKYAIIGSSGSGKSTLQDILLGLLPPTKGSIYFKGLELSNVQNKILYHSLISHVPQTPLIINSSIKNNIIYGSSIDDEDKLLKCAKDTALLEFLEKEGLDFICGENGINLSGGQKQRVAIARALYSSKELLFLDECTSALDIKTEEIILQNIFTSYKEKTIISITHKEKYFYLYNKIIKVMDKKDINLINSEVVIFGLILNF